METERFFHSPYRNYRVCIRAYDKNRQIGEKYCQFIDGKYIPLSIKDQENELGIDEDAALRKLDTYGVEFFDSQGWLGRTTQTLDKASQNIVEDLRDEVEMLRAQSASMEAAYSKISGINEVDLGEPSSVTVPQEPAKPKKKAGRPKGTGKKK
jgi:hypothetical protein